MAGVKGLESKPRALAGLHAGLFTFRTVPSQPLFLFPLCEDGESIPPSTSFTPDSRVPCPGASPSADGVSRGAPTTYVSIQKWGLMPWSSPEQ